MHEDLKLLLLSFFMQFSMFFLRPIGLLLRLAFRCPVPSGNKTAYGCGGLKWTRTTRQFAIVACLRLPTPKSLRLLGTPGCSPDSFAHWFAALASSPVWVRSASNSHAYQACTARLFSLHPSLTGLVGSSGLEPPTSRLSGVRSNRLSYEPSLLVCAHALQVLAHHGGDERDRTADPLLARQVLSQLSYTPSWLFEPNRSALYLYTRLCKSPFFFLTP